MNSTEVLFILQWWLVIFVIGIAFLPMTIVLFSRFFDKGYIFSKVLGIAIASYVVYLAGILRIAPFNQITSVILTALAAVVLIRILRFGGPFLQVIKKNWRIFLIEELFFLSALFVWCYIHGFNPNIHGLEKFMDFGFINSILRTEYFPPMDIWFTDKSINYYYYGHLVTAYLTKLSGVSSVYTFNFMLSTLFALCLTQAFSIGANLFVLSWKNFTPKWFQIKVFIAGLLTAALVTIGGNLHILYAFFEAYPVDDPVPIWELEFRPDSFPNSYWYPNATRYIYNTIHEFPIYSWVVADVHGHVLDIPFVLLILALMISLFINPRLSLDEIIKHNKRQKNRMFAGSVKNFVSYFSIHPVYIIVFGFLLALMYMTNAWDGAIYFLLLFFFILYITFANMSVNTIRNSHHTQGLSFVFKSLWSFIRRSSVPIILVATVFLTFTIPYNYYFKPFASGVGVLCAPDFLTEIEIRIKGNPVLEKGKMGPLLFEKDHCQRSYIWQFLMLYGFFYFFVFSFLIYVSLSKKIVRMDALILILIIMSTILILLPEFIYVKDIYPAHYRANTMFKLVFQAFIMLSIVSVYVIARISQTRFRIVFLIFSTILIAIVMMYPYLAIKSYYGSEYKGLHGTKYLENLYADDYAAILWLNDTIKGQPVILEAQGDSYTDYARVSSNTGLPTVLGWTVHQWLWRGSYDAPGLPEGMSQEQVDAIKMHYPAPRITDVKEMYEAKDESIVSKLLDKYNVQYVFVGTLEYEKYPELDESKFANLGRIVFEKNNTRIYKILK